ncbi:uncharacterized protein LOC143231911 [Tachypleus tridentatus]|uniref:uncharacterized protein LOC143231911 n=1 Tax=Tachypleus tridentatus TaxID=6853 RepID=UPI003FD0A7DA
MEHARQTENNVENHQQNNRYIRLDLSPSYREEVGHQCKRIIDFGRLCYLKEHNFCVDMVQYVEPSVSLENIALVARKDKQQLLSS